MYVCIYVYMYVYMYTVSEIVGLASQFATQNCLGCYSKLNLGSKFYANVATHLPHIKVRTLFIPWILYYYNCFSIHDLSIANFTQKLLCTKLFRTLCVCIYIYVWMYACMNNYECIHEFMYVHMFAK